MKKILSLALVLVMVLTMSTTAFAAEITGDSGSVDITYTYTNTNLASYVLTIPDSINLTTEESELGTVSLDITEVSEHKQVDVYISSPNFDETDDYNYPWHLLDEKGANKVPYALKYHVFDDHYATVYPDTPIFSSTEATTYSTTLRGNVKEAPVYAGNYSDTLTFTVSVLTNNAFWDSENITLTEDVAMVNDGDTFTSNKTLDLNGHTLTTSRTKVINVISGAKLTVNDSAGGGKVVNHRFACQYSGDIEINGGAFENTADVVLVQNNGKATINGGTFTRTDGAAPSNSNNDVFSMNTATAEINGGTFNGNVLVNVDGILTINNGTVNGYLVLYASGASITVNDGTFTGGIYIRDAGANLTINGGTFTGGITVENGADTSGVVIRGGTFDFDPSAWVDTTTHSVTENGNGTWTVTAK